MEEYGIQQYIEDSLKDGETLTEALDHAFFHFYDIFCNSLHRYEYEKDEDDAFLLESDVLKLIETLFKRKVDNPRY